MPIIGITPHVRAPRPRSVVAYFYTLSLKTLCGAPTTAYDWGPSWSNTATPAECREANLCPTCEALARGK